LQRVPFSAQARLGTVGFCAHDLLRFSAVAAVGSFDPYEQ